MYCGLLPVIHRSDAYSSTSYSQEIGWLPSPEVCRMCKIDDVISKCTRYINNFNWYGSTVWPFPNVTQKCNVCHKNLRNCESEIKWGLPHCKYILSVLLQGTFKKGVSEWVLGLYSFSSIHNGTTDKVVLNQK